MKTVHDIIKLIGSPGEYVLADLLTGIKGPDRVRLVKEFRAFNGRVVHGRKISFRRSQVGSIIVFDEPASSKVPRRSKKIKAINLSRFAFADRESLHNAYLAGNPPRPSVFIITGAPMSGKSLLAETFINHIFGIKNPARTAWKKCSSARKWNDLCAAAQRGYLFLDELAFPEKCNELLSFTTSQVVSWRKHRSQEMIEAKNTAVVFIVCTWMEELPPELERRGVKLIKLDGGE